MSNSKLVSYTKISPHRTSPRNDKIRKITVHHMAGNLSVETCGNVFQTRQASAQYGIGTDGRIGQYVDEADRAWSTAWPDNDNQAVNIEVANDGGAPDWHVSDAALVSLINLCVDICQRNGIDKLAYTEDDTGNLTRHNMFVPTACPGPYLQSKFPWIAQQVNARLGVAEDKPTAGGGDIARGSIVRVKQGAKTYTGGNLASFVYERDHVVSEVSGDRCVITYGGVVVAAVRMSDLTLVSGGGSTSTSGGASQGFKAYTVKISVTELRIRSGPGTDTDSKGFIDPGVYTIVEEANGPGASKWGRLKSGAGWISLDYATKC